MRTHEDYADAVIQSIKNFALSSNVLFESRIYDSYKYNHDRDMLVRLPAFHVYCNGIHERHFYPNTRPAQHIEEVIAAYLKRVEMARIRKRWWRELAWRWMAIAREFFRTKTAMERAEAAAAAAIMASRNRNSFRDRIAQAKEW
jgi:hypothetical protein